MWIRAFVRTTRYLLLGLAAVALAGCGSDKDGGGGEEPTVTMRALPLSTDTTLGYFTLGRNIDFNVIEPYGGLAEIDRTTDPWTATIQFFDVPEGRYAGYSYHGFNEILLSPSFPLVFCYLEGGISLDLLNVVSGGQNFPPDIVPEPTGCNGHFGVDRFIVNPNYEFDPVHRWAGSLDGENIVTGYIQEDAAGTPVTVDACGDCEVTPFGVFTELPDPPFDPWPDPEEWADRLVGETDSEGQIIFYLVVKPGWDPTTWHVEVQDPTGTERTVFRVSNGNTVTLKAE
jgi:hypothetical protein